MSQRILVIDDDERHLQILHKVLRREGYAIVVAENGAAGLDAMRAQGFDLVVTDLMMPDMNGIEVLKAARALVPSAEVIVMTAFGSVERAVEAMKEGAYDFIEKPIKRAVLLKSARQALERQALVAENATLRSELDRIRAEQVIVGRSEPIHRVLELVRQVAPTQATVLVQGASGTGKELVARELHRLSQRANEPFVAVNCAALPASILESELFGHERGAFTGAHQRKLGRFELAHRGTLFLDEIGELQHDMQAKLLRVVQESEFERVGGTKPVRVDVRLVAATNKTLSDEVEAGRFREDLFFRLNVIAIDLPTLAERRTDIPLLAEHFLQSLAAEHGRAHLEGFSREAMAALSAFAWPGNVRELRNAVERAVVLTRGTLIELDDLPPELRRAAPQGDDGARVVTADGGPARGGGEGAKLVIPVGTPLDQIKRDVILETLRLVDGDKKLAARLLGIATRTIYRVLESQ